MKWIVEFTNSDHNSYEFLSADGRRFLCKFNRNQGSMRLKFADHFSVFLVDSHQLINRKILLSNVYGSEVGVLTKNLWKENSGQISLDEPYHKINYKIDSYSSFIELSEGSQTDICEFGPLPHPGRSEHFMPLVIAMAWMQSITANYKVELTN